MQLQLLIIVLLNIIATLKEIIDNHKQQNKIQTQYRANKIIKNKAFNIAQMLGIKA